MDSSLTKRNVFLFSLNINALLGGGAPNIRSSLSNCVSLSPVSYTLANKLDAILLLLFIRSSSLSSSFSRLSCSPFFPPAATSTSTSATTSASTSISSSSANIAATLASSSAVISTCIPRMAFAASSAVGLSSFFFFFFFLLVLSTSS